MKQKTTQKVLTITKQAAEKFKDLAKKEGKKEWGLKFYVFPGGCSGFQYGMDFADKPEKNDETITVHGMNVFVDKDSIPLLKGVKVDYIDSLTESGFKIENPNAKSKCGCGKSFC